MQPSSCHPATGWRMLYMPSDISSRFFWGYKLIFIILQFKVVLNYFLIHSRPCSFILSCLCKSSIPVPAPYLIDDKFSLIKNMIIFFSTFFLLNFVVFPFFDISDPAVFFFYRLLTIRIWLWFSKWSWRWLLWWWGGIEAASCLGEWQVEMRDQTEKDGILNMTTINLQFSIFIYVLLPSTLAGIEGVESYLKQKLIYRWRI